MIAGKCTETERNYMQWFYKHHVNVSSTRFRGGGGGGGGNRGSCPGPTELIMFKGLIRK